MITPETALGLFAVALAAGLIGATLGLGGGLILIPAVTFFFGLTIREAAAISLLCVVATSTASSVGYLTRDLTDVRVGILLELPTVIGAVAGGLLVFHVPLRALELLFATLLLYIAWSLWRDSRRPAHAVPDSAPPHFTGTYFDAAEGTQVSYGVHRLPLGMAASALAGVLSSLLGVGGGIIKVPVMRLLMGIPLKVAVATSAFMIGITAAASVMLYFAQGALRVPFAAVAVLGILPGAALGPRLTARLPAKVMLAAFIVIILVSAAQMVWKAVQG
jgi:uncharacterized membrane protein YfcA